MSEEVEIVPGVVGPRRIVNDQGVIPAPGGGVRLRLDIRFDEQLGRYICHELAAYRDPNEHGGAVTSEVLRQVTVEHWIALYLLMPRTDGTPVLRELENLHGADP